MTAPLEELASVDGRISPTGEAMVPMKDDGLYRGDGAFEVIRLYEGKPFALVDHLDRLGRFPATIELEFDRGGPGRGGEPWGPGAAAGGGCLGLTAPRGGGRTAAPEPIPAHGETLSL